MAVDIVLIVKWEVNSLQAKDFFFLLRIIAQGQSGWMENIREKQF